MFNTHILFDSIYVKLYILIKVRQQDWIYIFLIIGRDEKMIVSDKHAANGHRTIPPFPENTKMAMFGKWSSS